jgi:hypothetical protein
MLQWPQRCRLGDVAVTDARCGIDQEKYRITAIDTTFDRRSHRYDQRLTLGAP